MKKIGLVVVTLVLAVFVGILFIVDIKEKEYIDISDSKKLWNLYEINVKEIKKNMDPIAVPNNQFEWFSLVEFDTDDEGYYKMLSDLFFQIRIRYEVLEDDNKFYTDSNIIKKYKDRDKITKEEFNLIQFHAFKDSCADKYKYYKDRGFNADEENKERFMEKVDEALEIRDKYYIEEPKTYSEYLYNVILDTEILKNMSKFINEECYRLQ